MFIGAQSNKPGAMRGNSQELKKKKPQRPTVKYGGDTLSPNDKSCKMFATSPPNLLELKAPYTHLRWKKANTVAYVYMCVRLLLEI